MHCAFLDLQKAFNSISGCIDTESCYQDNKKSLERKISLLNSQLAISNNLYNNPMAESALNVIDTLRNKTTEILSRPNNRELEIDFRAMCSAIQNNSSLHDPQLMQAYQDYLNAYQQKTSLYNIASDYEEDITYLYIYSTETGEVKKLQTPPQLDSFTYLTQLPNGKLFCVSNYELSGITMLIGVNGAVEMMLSGTLLPDSPCIYFSNSVYCFGRLTRPYLSLSIRFDLDQNRWIKLSPMPKADLACNSIIFNGNILISGCQNRNLFLYSIDIDSFSTIPYEFAEYRRKILVNAERLYLIESPGWIYESEIGSYLNWRRIGKSIINSESSQVYCVYNKGGIYISTIYESSREYYYFNLDQKNIIDLAYYSRNYLLRRVGKKIESIKYNQNYALDPHYRDEWDLKGMSLHELAKILEDIERYDERIKEDPNDASLYDSKGYTLGSLRRYLEAIECFDEAIKLNPNDIGFYCGKGCALYGLKRYQEAIEIYDKAIKLNPNITIFYYDKGNAFYGLKRYLEAIECYEEAIKLNPNESLFYHNKGCAFYGLKRYLEAIECYEKAIELNPTSATFYNDSGNALYVLERLQEAIQCYDEAIKFESNNPLHFCSRARVFNNIRQEEAALQDFNRAYNLWQVYNESVFFEDEWKLSEEDIKFINDILGRDRIELLQKMQI
ncbi:unnamed protein product [Blepharisma stoltei]|uniref:Tetratricopeptide repeat protein n=1 Tax=Blepharisma stoltei TaxID=1481888 RepID=A0AAU9IWM3_9CILI|nr:unnamed protein product [Blepharisma stoltei]